MKKKNRKVKNPKRTALLKPSSASMNHPCLTYIHHKLTRICVAEAHSHHQTWGGGNLCQKITHLTRSTLFFSVGAQNFDTGSHVVSWCSRAGPQISCMRLCVCVQVTPGNISSQCMHYNFVPVRLLAHSCRGLRSDAKLRFFLLLARALRKSAYFLPLSRVHCDIDWLASLPDITSWCILWNTHFQVVLDTT